MYRRYNTQNELKPYQTKYKEYLKRSRGGFLSTNQKSRLLGLKRGKEGTTDADFRYRLKQSARGAIVDLKMICDVADDELIKEIFQKISIKKVAKNQPVEDEYLVSIDRLINQVLVTDWRNPDENDIWKTLFVNDVLNVCLNFIGTSGILMTKSHERVIEEIRDLANAVVSVSVQIPIDKRRAVIF